MSNCIKLSSPATGQFWEIPVLFEDDHLIALDKPAGLLTSPDRYDPERPNLMKLLHRDVERGATWARQRQLSYLANAHRLDLETTGVLLLAKDKPTLVALTNQFGSNKPLKTYLALVHGTPSSPAFDVDAKLAPHPAKAGLMCVDMRRGKQAHTSFEVLERFRGYTLLKCQPRTGRTHQVRVHLLVSGLPIVSDMLYGGGALLLSRLKSGYRRKPGQAERPLLRRAALHAAQLQISHPANGTEVVITSPWPNDLTVAVRYLRRYAA
jgi:RluA family pseudouridine synthase